MLFEKAINLIKNSERIAIACHVNPDADTVGSALALSLAIKKSGKTADILSADPIGSRLLYLPGSDTVNVRTHEAYDLFIFVDCSERARIGSSERFIGKAKTLVIDHHKSAVCNSDECIIKSNISSASEMIFMLIEEWDESFFDKDIATNIFAGKVSDTGNFSFPAVTADTHKIAARLFGYGIDSSDIFYNINKKKTKNEFELYARVLSKAKFYSEDRVAVITFRLKDFQETGTDTFATEGVVNSVLNVDTVLVGVAVTEKDNGCYKFSIRSKDYVDAGDIAATFGGGGHRYAAGCRLYGCFEEVLEKILKACADRLR